MAICCNQTEGVNSTPHTPHFFVESQWRTWLKSQVWRAQRTFHIIACVIFMRSCCVFDSPRLSLLLAVYLLSYRLFHLPGLQLLLPRSWHPCRVRPSHTCGRGPTRGCEHPLMTRSIMRHSLCQLVYHFQRGVGFCSGRIPFERLVRNDNFQLSLRKLIFESTSSSFFYLMIFGVFKNFMHFSSIFPFLASIAARFLVTFFFFEKMFGAVSGSTLWRPLFYLVFFSNFSCFPIFCFFCFCFSEKSSVEKEFGKFHVFKVGFRIAWSSFGWFFEFGFKLLVSSSNYFIEYSIFILNVKENTSCSLSNAG